jgi:hypothetical protein
MVTPNTALYHSENNLISFARYDIVHCMMSDPDKQWRIDNAEHLKGLCLQFRPYTRWSESWDHDHCAGCWAKFAEFDGADIQHEGYATCADYPKGACYEWICITCFEDLKNDMQWLAVRLQDGVDGR